MSTIVSLFKPIAWKYQISEDKNRNYFEWSQSFDILKAIIGNKKTQKRNILHINMISVINDSQKRRKVKVGYVIPLDHCAMYILNISDVLSCLHCGFTFIVNDDIMGKSANGLIYS